MTEQPLQFGNKEASGLSELSGASPLAFNVLTDAAGAVHRRPGLRSRTGIVSTAIATTAITGIYMTQSGALYAVDGSPPVRHIYKVSAGAANLSPDSPRILLGMERPQFVETEALLVVAGGAQAQKVILATNECSRLADTSAFPDPPFATHMVAHQSRLVANDLNNKNFVRYSDLAAGSSYAGHEYWLMAGIGTSGFVSAEARADPIMAIGNNTNEIFVFGAQTLQVFAPDGLSVLAPSATRQVGCVAPYSVIPNDQTFAWLDDQRRFVQSDGRSFQVLSDPIAQTLEELTSVSDCFGYRFNEGFADVLVWTFPTDGLTFAYQQGVGWSRWSGWNGNWLPFTVTSHQATVSDNVVGLIDGRVGELSNRAYTDYDSVIRAYIETGFTTRGTDARKQCIGVRLALKRGKTSGTIGPAGWLGWRDWPGYEAGRIPIDLGASGDTDVVVVFRSLGTYRRRQWFFEFSGSDELILAGATEVFEVLGD